MRSYIQSGLTQEIQTMALTHKDTKEHKGFFIETLCFSVFVAKLRKSCLYILYIAIVAMAAMGGCKKKTPDNIGLPLLPGEDLLNALFTDSATLITHTVKDDSLRTDELTLQPLGNLNDPIFGITRASIFTQLSLPKANPSFGANPVLDSAVLSLVFNASQLYGDKTNPVPQKFEVYEVSEMMYKDSGYFSDDALQYYTTQQIGSATVIPMSDPATDSVQVDTLKYPPHIRIRMDKNLFQHFIDTNSPLGYTSSYSSNASFQNKFRGIYIKSPTVHNTGEGAILYIDLTHSFSRLTLFYHNSTDTLLHYTHFSIDKNACARFSRYEHDYAMSPDILNQINTPVTVQSDKVYVQPMAGLRVKITLPYLMDFFKDEKVAINKAELILPVDAGTVDSVFTAHPKLVATIGDSTLHILPDFFEGSAYFGGDYDATRKEYRFNIARYIQQILNGTRKNEGLYIITNARQTTANRVQLIGGSKNFGNRARLKITYTPLE